MENQKLNNFIEDILKEKNPQLRAFVSVKKKGKLSLEEKHQKKISALVTLLTPIVVIPQEGQEVYTKYVLENPMYREQIEDWIMAEVKRFHKF